MRSTGLGPCCPHRLTEGFTGLESFIIDRNGTFFHKGASLLRRDGWSIGSLGGRRSTSGSRRSFSWTTCCITGLIVGGVTGLFTALATGTVPILIPGLTGGLAGLPSNLNDSRNVELASRPA